MNRKYSSFMYGSYLKYALENDKNVIPLAPPDWEAKAKKSYVVNTVYLPTHLKSVLNDPRLETTLYILNKLTITGQTNTTVRFVLIKGMLFLDPFFHGISENMFFNSHCYISHRELSERSLTAIELKINMLGGRVVKTPHTDIDILLCPRTSTRKTLLRLLEDTGIEQFKNVINITTLNQIFRRYFSYTPIKPE